MHQGEKGFRAMSESKQASACKVRESARWNAHALDLDVEMSESTKIGEKISKAFSA